MRLEPTHAANADPRRATADLLAAPDAPSVLACFPARSSCSWPGPRTELP